MPNEKEVLIQVLEKYKELPQLWDKNHKNYTNRVCRNNAKKILLEIYKQSNKQATVKTMIKKIQNLKTNYTKELKKVKNSKLSGDEDEYTPTLWYYDNLSFLEDHIELRFTSQDRLKIEDNVTPSLSSDAASEFQSTSQKSSPPPKKKRITKILPRQNYTLHTEDTSSIMKEEDWEILGKSIGLQLRGMKSKQLAITQKIISDAIYYAKIGLLTENSCIDLGPTNTITFVEPSPASSSYRRHSRISQSISPSNKYYVNSDSPSPNQSPSRNQRESST